VLRDIPPVQNPSMDPWMQRLHPAIQHLGKARQFRHIQDLQTRITQRLGRPSGRNQFNSQPRQNTCKLHQPGLIGYRQKGTPNSFQIAHITKILRCSPVDSALSIASLACTGRTNLFAV